MSNDPIKPYQKGGKTFYGFQVYTGINPKTGKPSKTRRKGFTTKTKAKKALLEIKQQVAEGAYWKEDDTQKTFKDVFDEWYALRANELKESTLLGIKRNFKHLSPIHGYYLDQLTTSDIQKTIMSSTTAVAPKNKRLTLVRQVLSYAQNQGYINRNAASTIPRFVDNKVTQKKKKFLSIDEVNDILDDAKSRNIKYYTAIRLLVFSGLRVGELCALEWDDLKDGAIYVSKTIAEGVGGLKVTKPKTETSIRKVVLDPETLDILEQFKSFPHVTNFIFENTIGSFLNPRTLRIYLANRYKVSPHMFRHTHASLLFKAGVNPKVIQKRLGHTSFKITMDVYTHLFEEDEADNIEKFFDMINNE